MESVLFLFMSVLLVDAHIVQNPSHPGPFSSSLCKNVGINRHPTNCHKFVVCTLTGNKTFDVKEGSCPEGIYSETLRSCVPESDKLQCKEWPLALSVKAPPQTTGKDQCAEIGMTCSSDCKSIRMCYRGTDNHLKAYNVSCGNFFCKDGSCSYEYPPLLCQTTGTKRDSKTSYFQCGIEGTFPDYRDCRMYHICNKTLHNVEMTCPPEKMYNPRSEKCDLDYDEEECLPSILQKPCSGENSCGFRPYNRFCSLFYYCQPSRNNPYNIVPVLYKCPKGEGFDPTRGICDIIPLGQECAELSVCQKKGFVQRQSLKCTSRYEFCYPDIDRAKVFTSLELQCNNGHIYDSENERCAHINSVKHCRPNCKDKAPGFHRILGDCSAYYVCVNKRDQPISYLCPKGLVFNVEIEQCDFVENVPYCVRPPHSSSITLH